MQYMPWIAWLPGGLAVVVSPSLGVTRLRDEYGVRWVERGRHGSDYPLFRVTPAVQKRYGVVTVKDLNKVPFEVLWPRKPYPVEAMYCGV